MVESAPGFLLENYRGYLLLLARASWDDVLAGWGDPSDLVQQTLLEAKKTLAKFDGTNPAAFAEWLRKILANNLFDVARALRRKKRDYRRKTSIEAALEESSTRLGSFLAHDDPSPSDVVATAEQLNRLADAIGQLPHDQQEAVTLHHLRGLSLTETATQMRRSKATVAGLLRRGIQQLGRRLGKGTEP
jgi:RNA polymerase sigma-70 factor, ECF subfamily